MVEIREEAGCLAPASLVSGEKVPDRSSSPDRD